MAYFTLSLQYLLLTVFDGEFSDADNLNLKVDYSDCEGEEGESIENVQITPNNITLTKGMTQQYHVDVIYTDLSLKNITSEDQIISLDTSVVTIDANNIATVVGIGSSPVGGFVELN